MLSGIFFSILRTTQVASPLDVASDERLQLLYSTAHRVQCQSQIGAGFGFIDLIPQVYTSVPAENFRLRALFTGAHRGDY